MADRLYEQKDHDWYRALLLVEEALALCDASGLTLVAIDLCEAAEKLKTLGKNQRALPL